MAYKTYTTEAFVCGSKNSYTSDRSYLLFTKRAGMIWATARSVREERSRQRYALQDFSLVRVSLVKGRSGWRVGSVSATNNAYLLAPTRAARGGVTNVVRLLRRYVHGEVPHPAVFSDTESVLNHLATGSAEEVDTVLTTYTLRLLYQLGYISPQRSYETVLKDEHWLSRPTTLSSEARQAIKQAETLSHL